LDHSAYDISTVPFCEWSHVRAGNYAVDVVFSHTEWNATEHRALNKYGNRLTVTENATCEVYNENTKQEYKTGKRRMKIYHLTLSLWRL